MSQLACLGGKPYRIKSGVLTRNHLKPLSRSKIGFAR